MRSLSASTLDSLSSLSATLVQCWLFVREDNVVIGFTDHDRALTIESVIYHPVSLPFNPSFEKQIGFGSDQGECSLPIDEILITQNDILKGLWNRATVTVYFVDWQNPGLDVILFRGKIAALTQTDRILRCTLHGMIEDYRRRPIGRTMTRLCNALLGDVRCGLDIEIALYKATTTVQAVPANNRLTVPVGIHENDWFSEGKIYFNDGLNAGLSLKIQEDRTDDPLRMIVLWETPVFKIHSGDTVTLWAGCNKTYKACLEKFNNTVNFQGFPDLPSDDAIMRRPIVTA